jgi:hypothetical protein
VSAGNRLTVDQLAALAPGDPVVIETSGDFRRPRQSTGTVVRILGPHIVVSVRSTRGVPYVDHFDRRDGVRIGGSRYAVLVHPDGMHPAMPPARRRQAVHIDALYREWKRNRDDVEALRLLQAAIGDYLAVEV